MQLEMIAEFAGGREKRCGVNDKKEQEATERKEIVFSVLSVASCSTTASQSYQNLTRHQSYLQPTLLNHQ